MLYLLLYPLSGQLKLFNVLRYPSFRIVAAGLTAMLLGLLLGPLFIARMRELQYGASNVREDTPETHKKKAGTPSMGGILILLSLVLSTLLFADLRSPLIWAALTVTVGFGAIGFTDDWLKISKKDSKGLAGRKRLLLEAAIVLFAYFAFLTDHGLHFDAHFPFLWVKSFQDTHLTLPFVPTRYFEPDLGWLYLPFLVFVVVAGSLVLRPTKSGKNGFRPFIKKMRESC